MVPLLYALFATARSSLRSRRELALENLALRQQLAILHRKTKRPRLTQADRAFWVALCGRWPNWQNALLIVKPETVIGWHRKGFKLYWTWKSRKRTGRPSIDASSYGRTMHKRVRVIWTRREGKSCVSGLEVVGSLAPHASDEE